MFRVLYVDDDRDLRDLAQMSLSADPDIEALAASDAAAALRIIRDQRVDLLIVDLRMPDIDGHGLLRALHEDPGAAQRTQVLITTAGAGAAERDSLIAAGAVGVLKKPFDPLELPRIVRHLLATDLPAGEAAAAQDEPFG